MEESHDKKGVRRHLFRAGQNVWFDVRHIRLRHPGRLTKFAPKFVGPLQILEVVGNSAVRLDMPEALKVHPTVSVTLIKPFISRAGVELPPVTIDGELEWEVEAIIGHSFQWGGLQFKVQWKGDYENSFHEFVDFENSLDMLQRYMK